jgi:hypothetical protein
MTKKLKRGELARRAAEAGLPLKQVWGRINRLGWSIERALSIPMADHVTKSLSFKARKAGIGIGTVSARINKSGWSEERALSTPVGEGKRTDTLSHRARALGMRPSLVHKRINRFGWTEERAFSEPVMQHVPRSQKWQSVRARKANMKIVTMASTLLGHPASRDEAYRLMRDLRAIGVLPKKEQNRKLCKHTLAAREMGMAEGVTEHLVSHRVRDGWSIERAVTTPVRRPQDTLAHRARQVGMRPSLVYKRVRLRGWSEQRALSTPPLK